jgi:hypothetical protein
MGQVVDHTGQAKMLAETYHPPLAIGGLVMRHHENTKVLEVKDTGSKKVFWQVSSTIFLMFFIAEPIVITWRYLF